MRIYSNKLLSWPQIIHVTHAARLYSGVWCNYNFYTIKSIDPLEISTWAPLQLLEKDRYYYCYESFYDYYIEERETPSCYYYCYIKKSKSKTYN